MTVVASLLEIDLDILPDTTSGTLSNELWEFDIATCDRSLLENKAGALTPSARKHHTMESVGTNLYVFGGRDSNDGKL